MPPLAVDPEALSAAGSAVVAAGDGLGASLTALTAGFGAHTGLDLAGDLFGLAYQSSAESLLRAAAAAINACRLNGAKIELSASNYSKAEAASTLGGGGDVLPAPPEPAKFTAPGPPGTWGAGTPPPALWAIVQSFIDDVWPDGDVAGLHKAAGCWRTFGSALTGMQNALNAANTLVGAQQIPEGGCITGVVSKIGGYLGDIAAQCAKLATSLDSFADEVNRTQVAIRDLLHRLGSVSGLAHEVMAFFEGDGLAEVKKIAEDINQILHQLGREARAFEQGLKMLMQQMDSAVQAMETYMRGQFTHFLGDQVGNPVATVFDTWVNVNEGVLKGAVGLAQGLVDLDPGWFLLDPKGAESTWAAMTKTGLLNTYLHPQEAWEADKQMFRGLLHLDDWRSDRPGLGAGENLFDVATLFIPGVGEAGAGADAAAAGARGAEAADAAAEAAGRVGTVGELAGAGSALGDVGKAGAGLTRDLENLDGGLPKDPIGARPLDLPAQAPEAAPPPPVRSAPPGTPPPESPVAPREPGPAPASSPHEPASVPASAPADPRPGPGPTSPPAEPAPAPTGGPHEPATAPASAPAEPGVGQPPPGGGDPPGPGPGPGPGPTSPHGPPPGGALEPPSGPTSAPAEPRSVPASGPHEPGSAPAAAPHDEPAPVPAGAQYPPAPRPAASPREPLPVPAAAPAVPAGRLPSTVPQLAEHEPVPADRVPGEPAPAPAGPKQAPAAAATHTPAPRATPPAARPPELSEPAGGGPHGPGDGSPPAPHKPDGEAPPGDGSVGPYALPAPALVTPPPNGAFFWSGRTSEGFGVGPKSAGGNGAAESFATSNGGTTLEGLLDRNGVIQPKWSFDDPAAEEWWSRVSGLYAENVRGEVRAVVGSNLRPGNVWETVELPRLMANPNVTKIVIIDAETGVETTIFER